MMASKLLFSCLILTLPFLVIVHAAEGDGEPKQLGAAQSGSVMTSTERSVYAKSLFEGRCQMCHQLPEPDMLRPKQWRLILITMQQRMQQAGVPPLTEEETEALFQYLAEQAG